MTHNQWKAFQDFTNGSPTASNLITSTTSTKALGPATIQHLNVVFTRLQKGCIGAISINVLTKADLATSHPPDRFIMEAIG